MEPNPDALRLNLIRLGAMARLSKLRTSFNVTSMKVVGMMSFFRELNTTIRLVSNLNRCMNSLAKKDSAIVRVAHVLMLWMFLWLWMRRSSSRANIRVLDSLPKFNISSLNWILIDLAFLHLMSLTRALALNCIDKRLTFTKMVIITAPTKLITLRSIQSSSSSMKSPI